jgi:hypothetical protein
LFFFSKDASELAAMATKAATWKKHAVSGNPAGRPKGSRNRWHRAATPLRKIGIEITFEKDRDRKGRAASASRKLRGTTVQTVRTVSGVRYWWQPNLIARTTGSAPKEFGVMVRSFWRLIDTP